MQSRFPRTAPPLCAGLLLLSGCAEGMGGVELSWAFFDNKVATVYPRGDESDVCGLAGQLGGASRKYDLNVRLSVLGPCDDAAAIGDCDTVIEETFECDRFRGLIPEMPSSEDPYLMSVDVRIKPSGEDAFTPNPDCIAAPGPRERKVRPGRITDLAVYQLIIDASSFDPNDSRLDRRLDLEACRP